ncbi:glutathione-disulfide reductase [Ancylobacter terrae]|uniref:glutathione-disulfide reductase n=1 Tax=Ancylobacter sp. sgz301288 TaxID=3342077 RepID=UPI00385FF948
MTADSSVDLFVIGGGSGGVRAARIAAGYGARVRLAEEYRLGGTCVIRGCVPKKLLVYASRFAHEFQDAAGYGWTVEGARFDWPTLIANKDRELDRLEAAYGRTLANAGVEVVRSRAVVEDPHTVRLTDGSRVTAGTILVATGAHPVMGADIPGRHLAISSNEAFHLDQLPARIVVQGGGYIAVEFAAIFAGLGAQVTLVHRGEKLLRGFDEDIRDHLAAELVMAGVNLALGTTISAIETEGEARCVHLSDGRQLVVDQVMLAIGRSPNTAGLGLEAAGVALRANGAVVVDGESRSCVPSIYAVGDVTDRVSLTPVAIREGHAFADRVFGKRAAHVEYDLIPTAVFTEPEVGVVGLTEAAARAKGHRLDIYKTSFRPLKATMSGRQTRIFMKMVVDQASDRVLGVHIVGEGAGEMIQLAGVAMTAGATKDMFDRTVALHPSAAEELVTMRTKHESSDLPEESAQATPAI